MTTPTERNSSKTLTLIGALAACIAFSAQALAAQAPQDPATADVTALAERWEAAGNGAGGDPGQALAGTHVDGPQVVQDNFPPFLWTGAGAMKARLGGTMSPPSPGSRTPKPEPSRAPATCARRATGSSQSFNTYTYRKARDACARGPVWSIVALRTGEGLKLEAMSYAAVRARPASVRAAKADKPVKKGAFPDLRLGDGLSLTGSLNPRASSPIRQSPRRADGREADQADVLHPGRSVFDVFAVVGVRDHFQEGGGAGIWR